MIRIFKIISLGILGVLILAFIAYKVPLFKVQETQYLKEFPLTDTAKALNRLSLEQKIGQLFIIGFEGKTLTPEVEELIKEIRPGGILLLSRNIENENQLKNLITSLQETSLEDNGLPLFIAVDQEGEPMCRIGFAKENTSQSKIKNIEEAYKIGLQRGKELKELGINLNLAPVLDISQQGDFLFERSFQRSSKESGGLAENLILGQKEAGILTAIKHFPGYGGISFNPEEKLAILSKIPEISQFKKAIEANPEMVMTSNVVYKELDEEFSFTFSSKSIQFLRKELRADYLIISDDLAQNSLLSEFSLDEIVTFPLEAGVDIMIFSGWRIEVSAGISAFQEAVKNGEVSEERINQSVLRIIELKQKLKVLDY